jgi:hypothetical protein
MLLPESPKQGLQLDRRNEMAKCNAIPSDAMSSWIVVAQMMTRKAIRNAENDQGSCFEDVFSNPKTTSHRGPHQKAKFQHNVI